MHEILNWTESLERVDGDEEILKEIIQIFVEDAPRQLHGLIKALEEGDADLAQRQAHSLKGSALNVGAELVTKVADAIEKLTRQGELSEARRQLGDLVTELDTLRGWVKNGSLFAKGYNSR